MTENDKEELTDIINNTYENFFKLIDFNELELYDYFSKKKPFLYLLLIAFKIVFLFIAFLIFIFLVPLLIDGEIIYMWYSILIILSIVGIPLVLYATIDAVVITKFKYNYTYFRLVLKDMNKLRKRLNILINNSWIKIIFGISLNDKIDELEKKLDRFADMVKPIYYHIKNLGFLTLISFILSRFIYDAIVISIQNPFNYSENEVTYVLSMIVAALLFPLFIYLLFKDNLLENYQEKEVVEKSTTVINNNLKKVYEIIQKSEFK